MTDTERKVLIKYYAKLILDHNLFDDDLGSAIARMAELQREICGSCDGQG
jgi:hypothetical protein